MTWKFSKNKKAVQGENEEKPKQPSHHLFTKKFGHEPRSALNNPNEPVEKGNWIGVISIAILTYALGIGWYIPGGIAVPFVATFAGVSENNVDLSLTIYLVGLIVASLLVPLFFYKVNRKWIIVGSAIAYGVCNIIIGVSVNFPMLLFFRFASGIFHGAIFAVCTVVVSSLVPKNKRGGAVALCFTTVFASTVTLVPIFTYTSTLGLPTTSVHELLTKDFAFLEQYRKLAMYAQYWRWAFIVTGIITFASAILIIFIISKNIPIAGGTKNPWKQLSILLYYPFDLAILFGLLIFLAIFIVYPLLQKEWVADGVGVIAQAPQYLALVLAIYGLASTSGNQIGGWFANGRTFPNIYYLVLGVIVVTICLIICVGAKSAGAIFAFTIILPFVAYTVLPNIYSISLPLARHHDHTDAVDLESGITFLVIGLGGMIGTAIGGPICTYHSGPLAGQYNPANFIIVGVIVLCVCVVAFCLLIPIHWYMHVNKLVETKYKFYNQVFHGFPFIIDEYSTAEVRDYAYKQKEVNSHVRIWEIKPLFIRKHVQSKQDNK